MGLKSGQSRSPAPLTWRPELRIADPDRAARPSVQLPLPMFGLVVEPETLIEPPSPSVPDILILEADLLNDLANAGLGIEIHGRVTRIVATRSGSGNPSHGD